MAGPSPLAPAKSAPAGHVGPSISLEALVWAVLLALALPLRLLGLEGAPFTLEEAARAFDAFQVAGGSVPDSWTGDLAGALTAYLFRLFGEGEMLARLVPALAGCALVAALWFGRGLLGRGPALLAAVLVAFSPLFVLASRTGVPFSLGALLSAVMVLSFFTYLRAPQPGPAFLLALSLGLAPLTDAVATATAVAVLAFLLLGAALRVEGVRRALAAFLQSPSHWLSFLLVLAAAAEMALTAFGTTGERLAPAGLDQWIDMFALPRDGRPPEYSLALLLAYDWPLLLAGGLGFLWLAGRLVRRGVGALTLFQRFLLLWTALAALTLALAGRREAGQLLILLLPLAFLAGTLLEEAASALDWARLRRWWPLPVTSLALAAYAALLLSDWSRPGGGQQALPVALALSGSVAVLAGAYPFLRRGAALLALLAAAVLAGAFLSHSAFAVAFRGGAEFAVDLRSDDRLPQFRQTLEELAAERGGLVLIDPALRAPLAWYLRDGPFAFGGGTEGAAAVVVPAGEPPPGFVPLGQPWTVAEGWYPGDFDPLPLWRWLVYRTPYGGLQRLEAAIFVPTV